MIANIQNRHVQILCTLAQGDELVLHYPLPDHILGFHAQQSCEKLMKALISSHKRKYPFTHSLEDLEQILTACQEVLPSLPFGLKELEPFEVELRYDFGVPLSNEERAAIKESVGILRQYVIARILDIER